MQRFTVDEIVSRGGLIVEGVVAPSAQVSEDASSRISVMRVDRVWKGDISREVTVRYNVASSDCTRPPPFDKLIRFTTGGVNNGEISYLNGWVSLDLPVNDPALDQALEPYLGTVAP